MAPGSGSHLPGPRGGTAASVGVAPPPAPGLSPLLPPSPPYRPA